MWCFTHVHVVVQKAENLLLKGGNDTNNAFVVIELGKESYRTSIKENIGKSVFWNEECELKIPKAGNEAAIVLTAYHRKYLGLDQFLGTVKIPLASFDKVQSTIDWYKLEGKPGKVKGKDKFRGELEIEIDFIHKLKTHSLTSLPSKRKKSFDRITGSLFGLRYSDKNTGRVNFANTLRRIGLKKKKALPSVEDLVENSLNNNNSSSSRNYNNLDPGVISDEEDSTSHKSSESAATLSDAAPNAGNATPPRPRPRQNFLKNPQISISQWGSQNKVTSLLDISQDSMSSSGSRKLKLGVFHKGLADRRLSTSCLDFSLLVSPKPEKKFSSSFNLEKNSTESHKKFWRFGRKLKGLQVSPDKKYLKRTVDGCEDDGKVEQELISTKSEFKNKNKDELINMVLDLQKRVNCVGVRINELEEYLDKILVKVMETVPKILEKS